MEVEKDSSSEAESAHGRMADPVAEASRPTGDASAGSYVLYMGESFSLIH